MPAGRTADVVVVGAGAIGCASALRLVQAGFRTTLLDRGEPGAEASSAAAGILATPTEPGTPAAFSDLCARSLALYPSFVAELRGLAGLEVGLHRSGSLQVAFDDVTLARLWSERAVQRGLGRGSGGRVELLDARRLREVEPGVHPTAVGAIHSPDDAQVDPKLLMIALLNAAERAGVDVGRATTVRGVIADGGRVRGVETDRGEVSSARVVLCAGSWTSAISGTGLAPGAIRPVRGQIVQIGSRPSVVRRMIFAERGYLVPRGDGRLLAGSTEEESGFQKEVTVAGVRAILDLACSLVPGVADCAVEATWAGLRPASRDGLPLIGKTGVEGLFVATGHFRNGILLAPVTAEIVRDLVTTGASVGVLEPYSPARFAAP